FELTEKDFVVRISDREFWTDFCGNKNFRPKNGKTFCRRSTNQVANRARKQRRNLASWPSQSSRSSTKVVGAENSTGSWMDLARGDSPALSMSMFGLCAVWLITPAPFSKSSIAQENCERLLAAAATTI